MEEDQASIINLLKRDYLFQGLTQAELEQVAARFQLVELARNTVIYSEGSPVDFVYIAIDGRLKSTRIGKDKKEQLINIIGAGEFFGDQEFLYKQNRVTTVTAITKVQLMRITAKEFHDLVKAFPEVSKNIDATSESRKLIHRYSFSWLAVDESIEFLTRKHDVFLYVSLIGPIIMLVASIPLGAFALTQMDKPFIFEVLIITATILFLLSILWGLWNAMDWGNDFYVLTSQRVVWQEKVIALYDSRREAPLDTILAVNVVSSFWGRILDYGDVNVRTYTGYILMRRARKPYILGIFIEGYRARAIEKSKLKYTLDTSEDLEEAIRKRVQSVHAEKPEAIAYSNFPLLPFRRPVAQTPVTKKPEPIPGFWDTFLKVRYEQKGVITYRKHWFILIKKIWLPFLILILVIPLGLFAAYYSYSNNLSPTFMIPWTLIGFAVVIFLMGVLVYQFLDWTNDIYRLTAEQILDIEKKPLGQEVKRSANLENILSIEHERENIIGILLNFGDVRIMVGQESFVFIGVYNPDQVHQDVATYREAVNQRKKKKEDEREQDRIVNWFSAYHDFHDEEGHEERIIEEEE